MGLFDDIVSAPFKIVGSAYNEVVKPAFNEVVKPAFNLGWDNLAKPIVNTGTRWVEGVGNKVGGVVDNFTNPITMLAIAIGAAVIIPIVMNSRK